MKVANGDQLECKEKFDAVTVKIQGYEFQITLYALPVTNLDVVLRVPWLAELGPITTDYKKLTMSFIINGQQYCLRGDQHQKSEAVELKMIMKEWQQGQNCIVYG